MADVDLNAIVSSAVTDLHNTLVQAQQTFKALEVAAQAITAQASRVGVLVDAAKVTITDVDTLVKSVHLSWPLK